jgi:hypothetical protein
MHDVLIEAWEAFERGILSPERFRAFTCGNVTRLFTDMNPNFFDGTVVERDVVSSS